MAPRARPRYDSNRERRSPTRHRTQASNRSERLRLAGLGLVVALLHVAGWGLFLAYSRRDAALAGLGTLAYTFGLRHAFDADHIAAIDNTTRKLLQDGRRPLAVGFAFSLGHSTVVLALATGLAVAAGAVGGAIPALRGAGGPVGASVSGAFLLLIGLLNLLVLADVVRVARGLRSGGLDEEQLERRLREQGLLGRVLLRRIGDRIDRSWKAYPLGLLFGLGFDTASEIGLLAVAAGVATRDVPVLAVVSLPLVFAAGMSLMDTADGVFMSRAYGWAFSNPVRKVYYNLTVTSLSVAVALLIGTVELLQVLGRELALQGAFWTFLGSLDLGRVGYAIVGLFLVAWACSALLWKVGRIEERWSDAGS